MDIDDTMQENVEELAEAITGHKIVSVEWNVQLPEQIRSWASDYGTAIVLDNGKKVYLMDTGECCAHTDLESFLLHPEMIDHMIMGVSATDNFNTWHIYADLGDVLALSVSWSEGTGYYGYGFNIRVYDPES